MDTGESNTLPALAVYPVFEYEKAERSEEKSVKKTIA